MNCPNCGAVIKEGKFCNYCGAKLPDDTKRVEVNVHKRIEDVAEMKRADYETDESKLRQKEKMRQLKAQKAKRISCLILLGICIIAFLYGHFSPVRQGVQTLCLCFGVGGTVFMIVWILSQLITGKW